MRVAAILAAAGRGSRLGSFPEKQFRPLGTRSLYRYSLELLLGMEEIETIVLVVPAGRVREIRRETGAAGRPTALRVVAGGETRRGSILGGLQALPAAPELVLVHDAARPFTPEDQVRRVIVAARRHGAAVPILPSPDALKTVLPGEILSGSLPRDRVVCAQTPQGFRRDWLVEAQESYPPDLPEPADDAALLERLGRRVHAVAGSPEARKVTYATDWIWAEAEAARRDDAFLRGGAGI